MQAETDLVQERMTGLLFFGRLLVCPPHLRLLRLHVGSEQQDPGSVRQQV